MWMADTIKFQELIHGSEDLEGVRMGKFVVARRLREIVETLGQDGQLPTIEVARAKFIDQVTEQHERENPIRI